MNKLLILFLLIISITGVSAISATVSINPASANTLNTLSCSVTATATGDLSANITWYKNGANHHTDNQTLNLSSGVTNTTTSQGNIDSSETTRSDNWICQATITNQTDTLIQNSSVRQIENAPPSVTYPTTTQYVTEGVFYNITATAEDPDGDEIVAWTSNDLNKSQYGGEELFEISTDGQISFTPTYEQRGNHSMAISASDGQLFGGRVVLYVVEIVNQPPIFDPQLTDQHTTTEEAWEYNITGFDREDDPFNFTLASSDLDTVRLEETSDTTARIYLNTTTPRYADRGFHNITITIYDSNNASHNTTRTFELEIEAINERPVIESISADEATQGEQFILNVTATDADSDDELYFSIVGDCPISNPWTIDTLNTSPQGAFGQVNTTLTNDHIICRDVVITVTDFEGATAKETDSRNVTLNLTNVNDPPELFEIAQTPGTYNQTNMSDLTAAQEVRFIYYVHADDPDLLTYEGDELTFTDNTTLFDIDSETGIINFTPQASDVGSHDINITVTDLAGLQDSRILTITIIENQAPVLAQLPHLHCLQDENCTLQLQATDTDAGENLTFSATLIQNTTLSGLQTNTSLQIDWISYNTSNLSKVFLNEQVGNYTYNITVTDQWQATDSKILNITINNTNDAPFFDQELDGEPDNNLIIPQPIVVGFAGSFGVGFTDPDFINNLDSVTLTIDLTGPNPSLFSIINDTKTPETGNVFTIQYSPSLPLEAGNYTANFTIEDEAGESESRVLDFTVFNQSNPPNITHVQPYSNQSFADVTINNTNYTLIQKNTSSINVSIAEPDAQLWQYQQPTPNNQWVFDFTFADADAADENITVDWYKNGELIQSTTADEDYSLTQQIGWHDQGNRTYTVVITDNLFSNDTFTWNTKVENRNRAPINISTIPDRNITQTTTITDQMSAFYDPDDDLDDSGAIDGNQTNNLVFTADISNEEILNVSFENTTLILTPLDDGIVNVTFYATDEYGASTNLTATYNVIAPEEDETITVSSGGGGSSSTPVPIPISSDPEPDSISILVPEPVSIAYNQTIEAPIGIVNTGVQTLNTVTLTAHTEAPNVTMSFSQSQFESIAPGQGHNVTLTIENFRLDGTYEILVTGQSQNPRVNDTAVLFINSLEQGSEGDAIQTRVTFARDLLRNNPECLELNELLDQAVRAIQTNQLQEADNLVSAALDGCRFLISEANRRQETPGYFDVAAILHSRYMNYVLYGGLIVVLLTGGLLLTHYIRAAKKEQEEN